MTQFILPPGITMPKPIQEAEQPAEGATTEQKATMLPEPTGWKLLVVLPLVFATVGAVGMFFPLILGNGRALATAGFELSEPVGANVGVPDLDLPIEDLDLSERPRNCLKRAQINTIGELLLRSTDDLMNITNFGQKSLDEILQKLDERGLSLRS